MPNPEPPVEPEISPVVLGPNAGKEGDFNRWYGVFVKNGGKNYLLTVKFDHTSGYYTVEVSQEVNPPKFIKPTVSGIRPRIGFDEDRS